MKNNEEFQELSLDTIFSDRFARYSKYIIQERALPDVRDGLKPVQRRILYAMHKERNTHDKGYRKSAKTVGNVIGNYHPHGDSSVYSAMVRMSQTWKQRMPLIDMHGNNGSIDGDSAAAMRYTEARLMLVASLLMTDLDKETVKWAPNFDDTELEPTVLPAQFCNILVNGASGISAGYACDIPPHNPNELVKAIIHRIKNPECTTIELMKYMKGPDFPTGGIVFGRSDIISAFEKGKGKVTIRSKIKLENEKNHFGFRILEIPFEVNKAELVRKIEEIQIDKVISGIKEVVDETDRDGLSIAVYLQANADRDAILNYLYKYTSLQVSYHYNMVAIHEQRPVLMNLCSLLDAYIAFQKEVIMKRSVFQHRTISTRIHLLEGLIKAVSIIDEIIVLIRSAENRKDVIEKLQTSFQFSEQQATSIADLRLYRLTSTDILQIQTELDALNEQLARLKLIIDNSDVLLEQLISEMEHFNTLFKTARRTQVLDDVAEIVIDKLSVIDDEDVVVSITKEGYIKRTSQKSFSSSVFENYGRKTNDLLMFCEQTSLRQNILVFFSSGKYAMIPVFELSDLRWRDVGEHLSFINGHDVNDSVIAAYIVDAIPTSKFTLATAQGQIMAIAQSDLIPSRMQRMYTVMNLKATDSVVSVARDSNAVSHLIITKLGFGLHIKDEDVSIFKSKSKGIKGINLGKDDSVLAMLPSIKPEFILVNNEGQAKRIQFKEVPVLNRATKGVMLFSQLKTRSLMLIAAQLYDQSTYALYLKDETLEYLDKITTVNTFKITERFSTFLPEMSDIILLSAQDGDAELKVKDALDLADLLVDDDESFALISKDDVPE